MCYFIREAVEADRDQVTEIWYSHKPEGYMPLMNGIGELSLKKAFNEALYTAFNTGKLYVAEQGLAIIGWLIFCAIPSESKATTINAEMITYLHKGFYNQGIVSQLLKFAINQAISAKTLNHLNFVKASNLAILKVTKNIDWQFFLKPGKTGKASHLVFVYVIPLD